MKIHKLPIFGFLVFTLLVGSLAAGCGSGQVGSAELLAEFERVVDRVERHSFPSFRLTIYFMDPRLRTPVTVSVDDLISGRSGASKIVVDMLVLDESIGLFKKIRQRDLVVVDTSSCGYGEGTGADYVNARLHYAFETILGDKILDVTLWGYCWNSEGRREKTIRVNGVAVESNEALFNVIAPLLPNYARTLFIDNWGKGW